MITVELFLLNGHAPSANAGRLVDLYLQTCPGVITKKLTIQTRAQLMEVMGRHKIEQVPALEVPGLKVRGKPTREVIYDLEAMEKWCKKTVEQLNPVNRRRR